MQLDFVHLHTWLPNFTPNGVSYLNFNYQLLEFGIYQKRTSSPFFLNPKLKSITPTEFRLNQLIYKNDTRSHSRARIHVVFCKISGGIAQLGAQLKR